MASLSALYPVIDAMQNTLIADATLTAMLAGGAAGVRNYAIPGVSPEYAFVLIGNGSPAAPLKEVGKHTFGGPNVGNGYVVSVPLHIYSDYRGDKEVCTILNQCVALLNFQSIAVAGFGHAMWEYAAPKSRILAEDVNKLQVRHAIAEFEVTVMQ